MNKIILILKNIIIVIIYLIISFIIITIIINKNIVHCDSVIKTISWYDAHHIPLSCLGEGWENKIILPELGRVSIYKMTNSIRLKWL